MRECNRCEQPFPKFHRRYFGKVYCSSCYFYMFPRRICTSCNQKKRVYRGTSAQVCQQCLIQKMPCHRCKTSNYTLGKLTEYGPVCKSCAKFYLEVKYCCRCGASSRRLSRYLMFGEVEPICFKCLRATHFKKCSNCKEKKPPYFSKLDRLNLCKECTSSPLKSCIVCQTDMPSGAFGRKCQKCFAEATLSKRLKVNKAGFTPLIAKLYEEYTNWLSQRCGPAKASRQILIDRNVFEFLDDWHRKNHTLPNYKHYSRELTVVQNKQNILAKKFMLEKDLLTPDKTQHHDIEEKNYIRRLIARFYNSQSHTTDHIISYYRYLLNKYRKGLTNIRSIRLALTPAVQMVLLSEALHKLSLDQELLDQYLWFHLGQKNAITGFINYLRNHKQLDLRVKPSEYFVFHRTQESKRRLRLQMIDYLNQDGIFTIRYIKLAMAYFHGIQLPGELYRIELYNHCKQNTEMLTIKLAKKLYVLPMPVR